MNKLLLALFTLFMLGTSATSQAMWKARMSNAISATKEYSHRIMQKAQKPFLERTQKAVAKKFPTPQFKSIIQPDYKAHALNEHTKLIDCLSNSRLDLWKNRSAFCTSIIGLGRALDLNYELFLSLEPKTQLMHAGIISAQAAFCYFSAKKVFNDNREIAIVHNKLSSLGSEFKQEFQIHDDIQ